MTPDDDSQTRSRIEGHWVASELGDIDAEHAIYGDDAILDYPQSGERFVAHERQYFADPFPAPASRAALAEPIPARD